MIKSEKFIKGKPKKEYFREYNQRPDVKAKQRKYYQHHREEHYVRQRRWFNKKYKTDKSFREKIKKRNRKWYRSTDYYGKKRRGNPEIIKDICLEYGFSEEIADAIAMDEDVLDKKMHERGIL